MIVELEIKRELSAVKEKISEIKREQEALEKNIRYLLGYERALEKMLDGSFDGTQPCPKEEAAEPTPNFPCFSVKDPRDTSVRLDDPIVPNDCYGSKEEK